MTAFFVIFAIVAAVIGALIWLPAIADCNEAGGVLVTNAFNWPSCVAGAER